MKFRNSLLVILLFLISFYFFVTYSGIKTQNYLEAKDLKTIISKNDSPYLPAGTTPKNVKDVYVPEKEVSSFNKDTSIANKSTANGALLNVMEKTQRVEFMGMYGPTPCSPITEGGNAWYAFYISFVPNNEILVSPVYVPKEVKYQIEFKDSQDNVLKRIEGSKKIEQGKLDVWIYGVYKPEEFKDKVGMRRFRMYTSFQFVNNNPAKLWKYLVAKPTSLKLIPIAVNTVSLKKIQPLAFRGPQGGETTAGASTSTCMGSGGSQGGNDNAGEPVDIVSGSLIEDYTDLSLPGDLKITRHYNSAMGYQAGRSFGWMFNFEEFLRFDPFDGSIFYRQCIFKEYRFIPEQGSSGNYLPSKPWNFLRLRKISEGNYEITFKDHTKKVFNSLGYLVKTIDKKGNITLYKWELALSRQKKKFFSEIGAYTDTPKELIVLIGPVDDLRERLTITDPYGRNVYVTFNREGRVDVIKDWAGRTAEYKWDGIHLLKYKDVEGNNTVIEYNMSNSIKTINYPNGKTLRNYYIFDSPPNNLVVKRQDLMLGGSIIYEYGWRSSPPERWTSVNEDGKITTYYYNDLGQITEIVEPGNRITKLTYYKDTRLLSSLEDPKGNINNYFYDGRGNLTKILEPTGKAIGFKYDSQDRITDSYDELNRYVHYEYDYKNNYKNNLTSIENKDHTKRKFEYNPMGQITKFTDENEHYIQFKYDGYGSLTKMEDQEGGIITAEYNLFGLPVYINENGLETRFKYNNFNKITEILNGHTSNTSRTLISYDKNGNPESVTDAEGRIYKYEYDVFNRLTTQIDPLGNATSYRYNSRNELVEIIDAYYHSRRVSFKYDLSGNCVSKIDQIGRLAEYGYDKNNNLIKTSNTSPGKAVYFRYDNMNRLVQKISNNNTYYEYDGVGNIANYRDNSGQTFFYYDNMDRVTKIVYPFKNKSIDRKYDSFGNIIYERDIDGDEFNVEYDKSNKPLFITKKGAKPLKFLYNKNRDLVRIDFPNMVAKYIIYDDLKNIIRIKYISPDGELIYLVEYGYDKTGKIVLKKSSGKNRGKKEFNYVYDKATRLVEVKLFGKTLSTYDYDINGNRVSSKTPSGKVDYWYDAANQLLETNKAKYDYDSAGNLINLKAKGRNEIIKFKYDSESNLTKINLSDYGKSWEDYSYSGLDNLRISKYSSKNKKRILTFWFEKVLQGEISEKGSDKFINYGYGFKSHDGQSYYYVKDLIGSVVGITDKGGKLLSVYEYDEFGKSVLASEFPQPQEKLHPLNAPQPPQPYKFNPALKDKKGLFGKISGFFKNTWTFKKPSMPEPSSKTKSESKPKFANKISSPIMFAGYYFDETTGFYYLKSRYYDPETGRFIQPDKIGYIDGINLYLYCVNDPVNYVDPDGRNIIRPIFGGIKNIIKGGKGGTKVNEIVKPGGAKTNLGGGKGGGGSSGNNSDFFWNKAKGQGDINKANAQFNKSGGISGVGPSGIGSGGAPTQNSSNSTSEKVDTDYSKVYYTDPRDQMIIDAWNLVLPAGETPSTPTFYDPVPAYI